MAVTHRDVGKWVILKGKTRHGKNRINQHGSTWMIEGISTFQGQPAMHLRSENKTDKGGFDGRWVHLKDDKDFEWSKTP